jgi:hypothetical protein
MPAKIFIGRDIQKITHYPDTPHESRGIRQICTYLWDTWHHSSVRHYAIVANPKQTGTGRELSADLLIISEMGLGVVELKESFGTIKCDDPRGKWLAGPAPIKAGSQKNGYKNPHRQVQAYARDIRDDLIAMQLFPGEDWEQSKFELHTAVCFTNPDARLDACQKMVRKSHWQRQALAKWEKFAVLSYRDVRDWGVDMRFNVDMGEAYGYRPCTWTPEQVYAIATEFFGARPWTSMVEAMPPGKPLAYLTEIVEGKDSNVFSIAQETATIGRAPESHVLIAAEYHTVSRNHAVLTRTIDGFVLEDKSKNGTYVNNRPIKEGQKYLLEENDVIMLGGLKEDKVVCCVKFSRTPPPPLRTTIDGLSVLDH